MICLSSLGSAHVNIHPRLNSFLSPCNFFAAVWKPADFEASVLGKFMFLLLLTHHYYYYYYYHHSCFADACCVRDQLSVPVHVFIWSPVSPGNKLDHTLNVLLLSAGKIFVLKTVLLLLHDRTTSWLLWKKSSRGTRLSFHHICDWCLMRHTGFNVQED